MVAAVPAKASEAAQPTLEARDPRLDGLRGLAIALVMLYHTTQYGLARSPLEVALGFVPSLGWSGVDLFFVLSGFLITGILLRAKRGSHYYRAFYARRVLRIFPLYYAMLMLFLVVVPRIDLFSHFDDFWYPGADREAFWYWLFLSNVKAALTGAWQHQVLDITWSLAIEEHFYLLWPFAVRHLDERHLLWTCGATLAGALALRIALVAGGAPLLAPYVLTPCRLDTLATGAALAIVAARPGGLARLARPARVLLPIALALVVAGCLWVRSESAAAAGRPGFEAATLAALGFIGHPLVQTAGFSLLCALYGALLVVVVTAPAGGGFARVFEWGPLRSFGVYSYALYLLHIPAGTLLVQVFPPGAHPDRYLMVQPIFWALAFALAYGLARLSWAVLESPALRAKRFFPYRV